MLLGVLLVILVLGTIVGGTVLLKSMVLAIELTFIAIFIALFYKFKLGKKWLKSNLKTILIVVVVFVVVLLIDFVFSNGVMYANSLEYNLSYTEKSDQNEMITLYGDYVRLDNDYEYNQELTFKRTNEYGDVYRVYVEECNEYKVDGEIQNHLSSCRTVDSEEILIVKNGLWFKQVYLGTSPDPLNRVSQINGFNMFWVVVYVLAIIGVPYYIVYQKDLGEKKTKPSEYPKFD